MGSLPRSIRGLAVVFILWGFWFLPIMGLLLTRVSLLQGMIAVLFMGLIGGISYALLMSD